MQAHRLGEGTPATSLDTAGWVTQQWQRFLSELPDGVSAAQLADLDRTFRLSEGGNAEVLFLWLRVAIPHQYTPAYPALERFLTSQGRRKFVEPLYAELATTPQGRGDAARIYEEARPAYHATTRRAVERLLNRGGQ